MKLPASGHFWGERRIGRGGGSREEIGKGGEGTTRWIKWRRMARPGGEMAGNGRERRGRLMGGEPNHPRLFSTFSIMTLTWIRAQLLNDKYPGELIYFVLFEWRAAAVAGAEE